MVAVLDAAVARVVLPHGKINDGRDAEDDQAIFHGTHASQASPAVMPSSNFDGVADQGLIKG